MKQPSPLSHLREKLQQQQHRALVILSGSAAWQQRQLSSLWSKK